MNKIKVAKYFNPIDNKTVVCKDFLSNTSLIVVGNCNFVLDDYDAYRDFLNDFKQNKIEHSFKNDCKTIQNFVLDYFGVGPVSPMNYNYKYKLAFEHNENVTQSSLKNTKISQCIERSTFAHNLFKILKYDCALVSTNINFDGQDELHCFNVVKQNQDYYIFDLICSKVLDKEMPSPIMCKLPQEIGKQIFEGNLKSDIILPKIQFTTQSGYLHNISYKFNKSKSNEIVL